MRKKGYFLSEYCHSLPAILILLRLLILWIAEEAYDEKKAKKALLHSIGVVDPRLSASTGSCR